MTNCLIYHRTNFSKNKDEFKRYAKAVSTKLGNIAKLSLLWCRTLEFLSTEILPVGTVGWQASHCAGFGRMSLIYLGILENFIHDEKEYEVAQILQRVGVLWYCVLSSLYGDEIFDLTGKNA